MAATFLVALRRLPRGRVESAAEPETTTSPTPIEATT
jgi:hypothetical protein